ncbi:Retrovirus-related Pol polyprotein from transposon 17.6, partial [Mucuna pruriens]
MCVLYHEVTFLGFVVGSHAVKVDEEKVKIIQDWPTPKIMGEIRSLHGLQVFIEDLELRESLPTLKKRLTQAPILALPKFSKSFELECDASSIGIGAMIIKEGHPIAYFGEKLKGVQLNNSTYDQELYALVRALQT